MPLSLSTIGVGTVADDGTGDTARDGGIKINDNFSAIQTLVNAVETTANAALPNQAAAISSQTSATVASGDQLLVLDVSDSPNTLKRISASDFATAAQANATHTGDATGATALTLQPAAITGKGAVTVAGTDLLLVTDVSASPQVLGQVTAQAVANLFDASGYLPLSGGTLTGDIAFAAASPEHTVDGRNVSADGAKLDGIEAGATADQTANEILTALLTVDGAGSLLDADLLDGNEASAFATAAQANATHTGDATGATALTLQASAITGKGTVTVAGADPVLIVDASASPQVLAQTTAQSIANLRTLAASDITGQAADSPMSAAAGDLLLIADVSVSPIGLKQVTAQSIANLAPAGTGDFKADGTVDMTGQFRTDVGTFDSDVVDGASANAYTFDTQNTYSTAGANLLRLSNNATPVFDFSYQGGIDHANSGATTAAHSQSLNLNWSSNTTRTSSGQYSIVAGLNNTASGTGSIALGSANNTASGATAVAIGSDNVASATQCLTLGKANTASGDYSLVAGFTNTVSGNASAAVGSFANVTNRSTLGIGGNTLGGVLGSAQSLIATLKEDTADATQTALQAYSTNYVIPADTTWCFNGLVVARSDEADGNVSAGWKFEGVLYRDESNNTVIQGVTVTTIYNGFTDSPQPWITVVADDTNECLAIKVTGAAATNIRWVAKVDIAQVIFA